MFWIEILSMKTSKVFFVCVYSFSLFLFGSQLIFLSVLVFALVLFLWWKNKCTHIECRDLRIHPLSWKDRLGFGYNSLSRGEGPRGWPQNATHVSAAASSSNQVHTHLLRSRGNPMTVARASPKIMVVLPPEEQKLLILFSSAPYLSFLSCGLSLFRFSVPLPKAHLQAHRGLPKATLWNGSSFIQSLPSTSVHFQQPFAGPEDPSPADGDAKGHSWLAVEQQLHLFTVQWQESLWLSKTGNICLNMHVLKGCPVW